jgi:molybdenum cofactor cytidylyltransferase
VKPALVVLAAGASRRLGECKALADLGGSSPLTRLLAAGRCFDASPPLLITGRHHEELRRACPPGVLIAHNERWESGRTWSALTAAEALPGRDLCLAPVDVPLVPAEVFQALLAAWQEAGSPAEGWLAPRHGGRFGHPVVIGRGLWERLPGLLSSAPGASLRELRALSPLLLARDVSQAEILDDLDTLEDLRELRQRLESK